MDIWMGVLPNFHHAANGNNWEYDSEKWDVAQWETYLDDPCHKLFEDEVKPHDAVEDIQSKYIPQLFAEAKVNP